MIANPGYITPEGVQRLKFNTNVHTDLGKVFPPRLEEYFSGYNRKELYAPKCQGQV